MFPRWRNGQRANPFQIGGTFQRAAVGAVVAEAERAHLAPDAWTIIGHVMETG